MRERDTIAGALDADSPAIRRPHVLWLIKGLGPGGAEHLLVAGAQARDRAAFDVEAAYLLPHKNHLVGRLEEAGVPVHLFPATSPYDLGWARGLRRFLRANRFDLVHVHSPYVAGIARLVVRTLPRRFRPVTISTEHIPWSRYQPPTRWLNRLTFGLDHAHVAVSQAVEDSIPPRHRARVRVLYHGISLTAARAHRAERAAARAELGIGTDDVLVGTVANFTPQKGYPILLEAARAVVDLLPQARFIAIGQGPLEEETRALHATMRLDGRVRLLGYRADAVRLLAACDVFCLPSLYEGLPVSGMEALAIGLPFVATAVAGTSEMIRDGVEGLLVPPGDAAALADALARVIGDEELRGRLSAAAAARAAAFDIGRAARSLEELYGSVMRRSGRG